MKKRMLSFALAMVLVLSLLPATFAAAEGALDVDLAGKINAITKIGDSD